MCLSGEGVSQRGKGAAEPLPPPLDVLDISIGDVYVRGGKGTTQHPPPFPSAVTHIYK